MTTPDNHERHTQAEQIESGIIELDEIETQAVTDLIEEVIAEAGTKIEVSTAPHVVGGRRLSRLTNGRIVWVKERLPVFATAETLLSGIAATAGGTPLGNPDTVDAEGLGLFRNIRKLLEENNVDLQAADKGTTIAFEDTAQHDLAMNVVRQTLAAAAAEGPITVQWLQHNGISASGTRSLKAEALRVAVDSSGELTIERDPDKRLSVINIEDTLVCAPPPGSLAAAALAAQKAGNKLDATQQRALAEYRTIENGVRRFFVVESHRLLDATTPPDTLETIVADLQSRLKNPVFEEPLAALEFAPTIQRIREALIATGAWIGIEDETLRGSVWDAEHFAEALSRYEPLQAASVMSALVSAAHFYAEAQTPGFTWGKKPIVASKKLSKTTVTTDPAGEERKKRSGPSLAEILGISSHILPPSVLGVANALGMQETVYSVGEQDHAPNSVVVYGTTDFANPAELIMTGYAARSSATGAEAVYFADSTAHSVGSYLKRVLIPTIAALHDMDNAASKNLMARAEAFAHLFDTTLDELSAALQSREFDGYIGALETIVGKHETFAALYNALNQQLAETQGVQYANTQEMLATSNLTVGDLKNRIEHISHTSARHYEGLVNRLRAAAVPQARIAEIMKSLFGDGSWSSNTRQFLRKNTGGEQGIALEDVPSTTRLADLADLDITLGGNAWVVIMGMMQIDGKRLIVGHKNTRQGGNYVMGASEHSRVCVSPVVRVVPGGNNGNSGDGLDIGAYLLYPALQDIVAEAFSDPHAKIRGGQLKAIVELSPATVWLGGIKRTIIVARTGREPMEGGERTYRQTTLLAA